MPMSRSTGPHQLDWIESGRCSQRGEVAGMVDPYEQARIAVTAEGAGIRVVRVTGELASGQRGRPWTRSSGSRSARGWPGSLSTCRRHRSSACGALPHWCVRRTVPVNVHWPCPWSSASTRRSRASCPECVGRRRCSFTPRLTAVFMLVAVSCPSSTRRRHPPPRRTGRTTTQWRAVRSRSPCAVNRTMPR